jgi:pimeloyl-ACP methyl ester carboxylesterase
MRLFKLMPPAIVLTLVISIQDFRTFAQNDPPPDRANPAAMRTVRIPSHGAELNGFLYIAAGAGPHPVVLLLHGFPGNERNLDLAQAMRRAGWNVLYFDYRGSWGSPGAFSFTHAMEDTEAALAYLRDPTMAGLYRSDPRRLVLVGHSMGGMIAANVAAEDPGVYAVGLISAANMAGRVLPAVEAGQAEAAVTPVAQALAVEGFAPLAGCTPEGLARELLANAAKWNIPGLAPKLAGRPVFVVTSDDGLAPASDELVAGLTKAGDKQVTALHLKTDHAYSDKRLALERSVLGSLASLKP